MRKKVLITGGSGLVGRRLTGWLAEEGWEVALLSRGASSALASIPIFNWNPGRAYMDPAALEYAEHIVHLAGANIGSRRWTPARKKRIIDSRVKPLDLLKESLHKAGIQPRTLISSSAVGYYGTQSSDHIYAEEDPPGEDFTATVCRIWEGAAEDYRNLGTRVVTVRTGLVLSCEGGALPRLARMARMGLAAPLGSGRQAFPWIHIDDLCLIYRHLLDHSELDGSFNAVAPQNISNQEFTRGLARQLHRPNWLPPIPRSFLRLALGEMSTLLTEGSAISSEKIRAAGFHFQHPELEEALAQIFPLSRRKD